MRHVRSGQIALVGGLIGILAAISVLVDPSTSYGQESSGSEPGGDAADPTLLQVPVSRLSPGQTQVRPAIANPVASDPGAINRGQSYFNQFNCVGCHAPNGAGGIGPALSNHYFVYGSDPAQIYLSILQGRPNGMPAWNNTLPEAVIWDLVAYIEAISKDPQDPWLQTVSPRGFDTEQVPAEAEKTTDPWAYLESFSYGRAPNQHGNGGFPSTDPKK
jgi:cytochrome c oxidase cbb3-type subunit 3